MKAKVRTIIPVLLSAVMCGSLFAGCTNGNQDNNQSEHTTHTWSTTYVSDGESGHHRTSTCTEHEVMNEATTAHEYDNDQDATCNKCDYVRTVTPPVTEFEGKIYVVGDSTVCSFNDNYYLPRYGYGTQLAEYLNVASDQIVNLALSGRSSKSFLTESNYTTLKTSIAEGDYLIIGFGHNDEKSDEAARYTDANGTYTQATTANGDSFAYTLYENYVKMATDKGATPILCTPIVRYDSANGYKGAKVHDTTSSDKLGKGGDYSAAIRKLGQDTNTTVIDLTELTKAVYTADNEEAAYFHAYSTHKGAAGVAATGSETPDGRDDTHINKFGAKMVAYQFANALKATDNSLKSLVKDGITAPTKTVDYVEAVNTSFVKPEYTPFDPSSYEANELGGGWYKTAMGELGGDSISPFEISYADGIYTVGNATGNKGKIESKVDGFAAAFMQIEKDKNFTATATVKVKSHTASNSQASFGMMLRDDIIIDKRDTTLASNYVSAGALSTKGVIFSRENKTLSSVDKNMDSVGGNVFTVGNTYELSITRVGQTVTGKFGTAEKVYTDFDFFARDNDYMYLCLYAVRSTVVEFSNVSVTITGTSQGA